jgi:hypothetical protein
VRTALLDEGRPQVLVALGPVPGVHVVEYA